MACSPWVCVAVVIRILLRFPPACSASRAHAGVQRDWTLGAGRARGKRSAPAIRHLPAIVLRAGSKEPDERAAKADPRPDGPAALVVRRRRRAPRPAPP